MASECSVARWEKHFLITGLSFKMKFFFLRGVITTNLSIILFVICLHGRIIYIGWFQVNKWIILYPPTKLTNDISSIACFLRRPLSVFTNDRINKEGTQPFNKTGSEKKWLSRISKITTHSMITLVGLIR